MKFCSKCGNELRDEAVLCPKCGCMVPGKKISGQSTNVQKKSTIDEEQKIEKQATTSNSKIGWMAFTFGILSLVHAILYLIDITTSIALFDSLRSFVINVGIRSTPLLAIITSIKGLTEEKNVYLILGLIFGCIAVLIFLILSIDSYNSYYWL